MVRYDVLPSKCQASDFHFQKHSDALQIALELDQQERAFMAEGGMESEDYLRYIAEDSGNVAADGNFSVQVGSVPLHNKYGSMLKTLSWCQTLYVP